MGYGHVSPYNRQSWRDPYRDLNQGSEGEGSVNWSDRLKGFDPRDIMQGDAFQRMMGFSREGSGAYNAALGHVEPTMEYLRETLGKSSPLGSGRGNLVRSAGYGAIDSQIDGLGRRVQESSTRYGRASDPESAAFSEEMARGRAAGGYGAAEQNAQMADLNERQMNESFRKGISDALAGIGLQMGGLKQSEHNAQVGAAGSALQSESFARNTAAELLTRIMGYGQRGGSSGALPLSLEDRGRLREMQRQSMFGHIPDVSSLFRPFGAYGNYGGPSSDRGY